MIIFLGDSFTWGQGLYSKKWLEEGKSIEYCNQHMPPKFSHENISYSDDEYRKRHHFPNLVAKHYDRPYYTKSKNGGNNSEINNICRYIGNYAHDDSIDLVVVQFTEFMRSIKDELELEFPRDYALTNIEEIIYDICKKQIKDVYESLIENKIKNFIFFSWMPDIGNIIKTKYSDHYVPLYFNNMEYTNFYDMCDKNQKLTLGGDLGVDDGHLSELGHQVIAESIIKKVDTMNIDFIRPK